MDCVTADSNIYVSALKFGGKSLTLLDMALEDEIELAVSDSLRPSYRLVFFLDLARPLPFRR